jgi:hypothetical protein
MTFLEKDLEDIIFNATYDQLSKRNLFIHGKKIRQLKIGNYGIADMVTIEKPYYHTGFETHCKGLITIYELKKDNINFNTFQQIVKYAKGIQSYLEHRGLEDYFDIQMVTIGKNIDISTGFTFLCDLLNVYIDETTINECSKIGFSAYTYKYDIDGLSFKRIKGYKLTNEGF